MAKTFTDSAGMAVEYRRVDELQPGDVVCIGWKSTVERVEVEGNHARIYWEGFEHPDQWNPISTRMPVVVGGSS